MAKSSVFEDRSYEWNGRRYTIKGDRMMVAIGAVERVITLKELAEYGQRDTVPLATVAAAYGVILRHAGADVTDEEVYQGMFVGNAQEKRDLVVAAVQGLTMMMIPPEQFRALSTEGTPGKLNRRQRRAAAKSSQKHSS